MKGTPQHPVAATALDGAILQAVKALRDALRAQRTAEREYDAESRSAWRRDTTLEQLRRATNKAVDRTDDARTGLDTALLGDDEK